LSPKLTHFNLLRQNEIRELNKQLQEYKSKNFADPSILRKSKNFTGAKNTLFKLQSFAVVFEASHPNHKEPLEYEWCVRLSRCRASEALTIDNFKSDLQNVQRQEIEQLHRMYKAKIEGIQEVMQPACFPCRLATETIEQIGRMANAICLLQ
jgi:hypothetical protein